MSQNGSISLSPDQPQVDPEREQLERRSKNGAGWFFWIAGLSVINSIIFLSGSNWNFILGLGITQVIAGMASAFGGQAIAIAVVITLIIAGVFVVLGIHSRKNRNWAFVIGIILYAADALIFLLIMDWLGIAFHILALVFMVMGARACFTLNKMSAVPVQY